MEATLTFTHELENSRRSLLGALDSRSDVTFIRIHGNIGDELIYAGARQLLSTVPYREISFRNLTQHQGHTAIIAGGGGWCRAFHSLPNYLREAEQRFEKVVVFPSSFDTSVSCVKESLAGSKAIVFARERQSYSQIRNICDARLAFDTAFFFNFEPYRVPGRETLIAFRTDKEAERHIVPLQNNDISCTCESMDEWLWEIARSNRILTDRAHVLIAAAMLGKKVRYRPSNYHKVSGIAEYALSGFDVERMSDDDVIALEKSKPGAHDILQDAPITNDTSADDDWHNWVIQASREIAEIVPSGGIFILIDDDSLGQLAIGDRHGIPFLERAGNYDGPPRDSDLAIHEFERSRERAPAFVIFAWPAFWWFNCYPGFAAYLRKKFRCIVENDRLVAFALNADAQTSDYAENLLNRDVAITP
jgi:exopolysaccharide biosynthesis predicted pyruvyltransferase EpsI